MRQKREASKKTVCISVGNQGRKVGELCEALAAAGADALIDVRLVPWSQRPEFRKSALAAELQKRGVEYVHFREGGNPFRPRKGEQVSVKECERKYRKHLGLNPEVVSLLSDRIKGKTVAVLCFESKHGECHRSVLLSALQKFDDCVTIVDIDVPHVVTLTHSLPKRRAKAAS